MGIFGDAFQEAHNNLLKKEEERRRIREEEIQRERLAALRAPAPQPVQQPSSFSGIPLIGEEEQRALQRGTTRGGAPLPENTFLRGLALLGDATLGRIGFAEESDPTATKALSRAIDVGGNIATIGASHALQSTPDNPYQPISTGSDGLDKTADIVGTIGGYVGFGRSSGTAGVGRAVEQKIAQAAPALPRIVQRAGGGAAEGLISGIGEEFADYHHDFTGQDETVGQRLGNIALGTGLGGGIGAVAEPIGKGIGSLLERLKKPAQEVAEESRLMPGEEAIDAVASGQTPSLISRITEPISDIGERLTGGQQMGFMPFAKPKPYEASKADTASQIVTRANKVQMPLNEQLENLYMKFVDDLRGLKRFENSVEDVLGRPLNPGDKAYMQALNSRGSDMVARQILTDKLVDHAGNPVGKSLREILQPLPKGKLQRFEDYLINKHAITRFERGEKVYRNDLEWTPEVGTEKIKQLEAEYPEFAQMADELYQFQREVVNKWLVDTGLIDKKVAESWFEANPFYVPNKRQFTELEKRGGAGTGIKKGFANQKAPVKEYSETGSQRPIVSPIESIIENVDGFVKAAKRNEAMQTVVRNLKQAPDDLKGWAEIVEPPKKVTDATKLDLTDPDALDDLLSRFTDDFDKSMQKQRLDHDNIVRAMVDGQPVHVKINDGMLLDALTSLGPEGKQWLSDKVGALTRMFKTFTTGANPVFAIARNLPRDVVQSYVQSKTAKNPVTFMRDIVGAFFDISKNGEMYQRYKNVGGGYTGPVSSDINQLARTKRQLLPQTAGNESTSAGRVIGRAAGPLKKPVLKIWDGFWDMINAMENAPRLAEFKRISKYKGEEAIMKALYEAQEVSVNFRRRGSVAKEIDKWFPYFNAAMQGLDKIARTFKDDPAQAVLKSILSLTVPTVVLYALNRDDPAYQQLSNSVKDDNWLIPKGDGTFWKIAKPRELATVFSDIPERMLRQFAEEDPEAWKSFSKQVINAFLPPGVQGVTKDVIKDGIPGVMTGVVSDTIAAPAVDVAANRNFLDAPIVPGTLQNLPPELQYDEQTTSLAKSLGQATGSSPKKLDYLMRQYLGGAAELAQPLMQQTTGGENGGQRLWEALKKKVTADPVYSNEITQDFYEKKEKLDQARAVYMQTGVKNEDFDESLRKRYNRAADKISELRKLARKVQADQEMSAEQKRLKLREIQSKTLEIAQKVKRTN